MLHRFGRLAVCLGLSAFLANTATAQLVVLPAGYGSAGTVSTYATPLPPGPGSVPLPLPAAPTVAPILMPIGAPTAAPVGIYTYPGWQTAAQPYCEDSAACSTGGRTWFAAEFLYAATQGSHVPPLVTVSPPGTPLGQAGALYIPTTQTAFGGHRIGNDFRPGFRVQAGYWFDESRCRGIDATFFALGDESEEFVGVTTAGGNILARPLVFGPTSTNFGFPVVAPGGITASVDTTFLGGDVNYRCNIRSSECGRLDGLLGYRILHLGDSVDVWNTGPLAVAVPGLPAPIPVFGGTGSALVHDSFRTRNYFHGAQVGLVGTRQLGGGFYVEGLAKVALGVTVARAETNGLTQFGAGNPLVPSGLLVSTTNTVADTETYFGVVPEAGLKLGYEFSEQCRGFFGYTFLYWSDVRRASDQIDLTVLSPGRPAFPSRTTDVWMQGWSVGLQYRY